MTEIAKILPKVFVLRDASEQARRDFAHLVVCHEYPKGNILYYHAEPGEAVYLLVEGQVKVSLISEEGREVILNVVRPGGLFGLIAALDGGSHMGTAATTDDCRIGKIPRDRFLAWLNAHPQLYRPVAEELARLLRAAYEKIGEQALLPVKKRLLSALMEIARSEGVPAAGDEVEFVRPTHQVLAERVGSSRVVISRLLKELLEEDESLEAQGRVIRVSLRRVYIPGEEF